MQFRLTLRPTQAIAACLAVGLVFVAHLAHGANSLAAGLGLASFEGALLLGMMALPWVREGLADSRAVIAPAIAFALVIAAALWTLTPFGPGGANPAWTYVDAPAAITIDRSATLTEIVKLLGLGALFLSGFALGGADDRGRWTLKLILIVGAAFTLFALIHFVAGAQGVESNRLAAMFGSANTAGSLLGVLCILATAVGFAAERRGGGDGRPWSKFIAGGPWWALALLFAACLVLTASRGALLGTAGAFAAFFALEAWAGKFRPRAILGLSVAGAALIVLQGAVMIGRMGGVAGDVRERGSLLAGHWKIFEEAPLLGYGLGSFDTVNKLHLDRSDFKLWWVVRAAHNVYVQWLEEAGLLGALPMFACIGLIVWGAFRGVERRRRSTTLIRGLIAANMVFLIHGWSDYALQVPSMTAFWSLLLGLQLGLANASSTRKG